MDKKRLIYIIPALICVVVVTIVLIKINIDRSETEAEESLHVVTETPNENMENKEYLMDDFHSKNKDYEVKDYVFGNENSLIYLAIAYYDKVQNTDCNIAIISKVGTGYLNIASGWESFSFYTQEKMKIIDNDTLSVSLIDNLNEDIYDYKIKYIVDGSDITYDVDSGKRKTQS